MNADKLQWQSLSIISRGRRGRDRKMVRFTTTYAVSANRH